MSALDSDATRASFAAVRSAQLRAVGSAFLRTRPLIVGPAMVVFLALLVDASVPPRQLVIICVAFVGMLSFFCGEAWYLRKRAVTETLLFRSLMITTLGISMGCVFTGGLASPVIPLLFAPVVVTFSAFGRGTRSGVALGAAVTALVVFAVLPADMPFPPIPPWQRGFMMLGATVTSMALLWVGTTSLTDAFARSSHALASLRRDLVEQAATRSRSVDAIGARVAHELKNPLTSVKGLVQLMGRSAQDHKNIKRIQVVEDEIGRMEQILREYLSFSRPLEDLRVAEVELSQLVRDVADIVEAHASLAGVKFTCDGEPARIIADAGRLKQALLNLTLNAVQASTAGQCIRLTVATSATGATIEIQDSGRGMSQDELQRLGTPFFTTREDGTGLGAAVAQSVIAQHGGLLTYSSEKGRGTTARIELGSTPGETGEASHDA